MWPTTLLALPLPGLSSEAYFILSNWLLTQLAVFIQNETKSKTIPLIPMAMTENYIL